MPPKDDLNLVLVHFLFLLPKGNVFFSPDKHYEPVYLVIERKIWDLQLLTL